MEHEEVYWLDLFLGVPLSEIKSKQSTQIKVLSEEEIEKMRVACRVRIILLKIVSVSTILAKSLGTLWYFPIQKCIRGTKHLTVHPSPPPHPNNVDPVKPKCSL